MENDVIRTQVIILGGGITGLAAALFLAQQGVDFILIEKREGTSVYPRSRTIDARTMELFRGIGLSEALREGGKALAPAWGILRGNTLVEALQTPAAEIMSPAKLAATQKEIADFIKNSPEGVCRCTQDISEAIMCTHAQQQGADIRFHHHLLSFTQHPNEVEVLVQNRQTAAQYTIRADYMIAADGASSFVRNQLNVPVSGNGSWTDLLNIYFEADLAAIVKGREFSQFLIETPEITGFLLTINNQNKWAFHLRYYPEKGETAADYTITKLTTILHRILGIPAIKISILKVLPWQLTVRIAEQLRRNRIFLAGDAAHTMTPYAGKGANTGVQDAQNIAWKLAAVLKNQAATTLLDTYHTERQPVGAYYATLSGQLAGTNGLVNTSLLPTKAKDLMGLPNFGYQSSAIKRDTNLPFTYFVGEPGTRVPHVWLDELHNISSIDWIKGQFVLIAGNNNWQAACDKVKEQLSIDIRLVVSADEKWQAITGMSNDEALLVRPDDFVVARLAAIDSLGNVMTVILGKAVPLQLQVNNSLENL
ncbi:FAD-dependent monooxygenase [Chitinophaga nivalis]|uniref:FAD-dependent monooxygenase n=1 Tax=Chitinophaga nivalis TaxID=2991709 RepID=A0ABT3IT56_9BACT|nr:FAD-dependent monooxygenase [Chitinophaga nivalis]MCW3463155.1 FAD-dependent monooxygenase [Chitinophaga nivalis]MCW3487155.1 FAD-dependent monooxygenase [Chitinophaga nivalis]